MHPALLDYTTRRLPADPSTADLCVVRCSSVYSILPLSSQGFRFVVDHHEAGIIDGDLLSVPMFTIASFLDEVFDRGLRVV